MSEVGFYFLDLDETLLPSDPYGTDTCMCRGRRKPASTPPSHTGRILIVDETVSLGPREICGPHLSFFNFS